MDKSLHIMMRTLVWLCGALALIVIIVMENDMACTMLLGVGAAISFADELFNAPLLAFVSLATTAGALLGLGSVQSNQSFLLSVVISYVMSIILPYYIRTTPWTRWMTKEGREAARQEKETAKRAKQFAEQRLS